MEPSKAPPCATPLQSTWALSKSRTTVTLDAPFADVPQAGFIGRLKADKAAQRAMFARFTTQQIKDELLERGCTDFDRLTPWLKCALLLVIMLLALTANIGSRIG